ncbi:hypothetical protein C8T65DRAFT_213585 [Cerioporus squamosus]|nr:hypothetical protein C8T65DRAFT_213585 [Cerioporus squamosus]
MEEEEEAEEDAESPTQTGLRIRVPPPPSSRQVATAGTKRALEQTMDGSNPTRECASGNRVERKSDSSCDGETSLLPRRGTDLAKLPQIVADLSASDGTPEFFTRESIATTLGGNARFNSHVHIAEPTPLSSKHGLRWYLCVTMSSFAWLPSAPGAHGFLHMDVDRKVKNADGSDANTIEDPLLPLFVGIIAGSPEVLQYYGMYRLSKVKTLSIEEWEALPSSARTNIVERRLRQMERESRNAKRTTFCRSEIRARFASGEYHTPCNRLQCVQFDASFYRDLVEAHTKEAEEDDEAHSVEQQVLSSASNKRRRVSSRAGTK